MTAAVEVDGVTVHRGDVRAVDAVSLTVAEGSVLALLGPNGAGKTSLLRVVAGLARPSTGTVRICGLDVRGQSLAARRRLGVAGQDVALHLARTARANLALFAALCAGRGPDVDSRVDRAATRLGLAELLDRRVEALSAGERQRVHVAAALVTDPDVLILDEPTSTMDPTARADVMAVVRTLAGEGVAVIYATNVIAEAARLADTVAILDRGRLVAMGSPEQLVASHASPVVEVRFDGPPPTVHGDQVEVTDGGVLRHHSGDAGSAVAEVLSTLGPDRARVRRIDVVDGDLEAVFLALTGRRFVPAAPPRSAAEKVTEAR